MIRLEVAVAVPLWQTLTYLLDDETDEIASTGVAGVSCLIGRRVLVPLGQRRVTGYVLGLMPEEDIAYKLRKIVEFLDQESLFPANLIPFFRWVAKYYHYPLGEVIKTALPGGLSPRSGKQIHLTDLGRVELKGILDTAALLEPGLLALLVEKGHLSVPESRKIIGRHRDRMMIDSWKEQGLIEIREVMLGNAVKIKQEICYCCSSSLDLPPCDTLDPSKDEIKLFSQGLSKELSAAFSFTQIKTLYFLKLLAGADDKRFVPIRELTRAYSGAAKALPLLVDQGLVQRLEQRVFRNPYGEKFAWFPRPETLTEEQEQVLSELIPAIEKKAFATFLLHGVTGCGKTEVYLRATEATLAAGRDVLVLVPEIALATQLEAHFVSCFGDRVLILHSGLSTGERYDQWAQASRNQDGADKGQNEPRIVIGARSAVFAPLLDPGLIVVDEEHDNGFKQDDGLRYNGRDLAVLRGRLQKAVVLLGSATPSVTSFCHARQGKYTLLTMSKRVQERSLPSVTLVDLRNKSEKAFGKALGHKLQLMLQETLAQGKQSLLLLNRRGFASVVLCQDCGKPVECRHCHISLTYHKGKKQLVCHYCGYSLTSSQLCSGCQSEKLVPVGFGTERIEQEVMELLPTARIARLDSDTALDRKKFLHILSAMHNREIDILIGTQMIAKGHDFPEVTLVGVVWADGGLSMPDFRAAERTYQLLSQVSGRAGRGDSPGQVIIQTLRPDHYAVAYAQRHAYTELYEKEMAIRKMPAFPPMLRMINVHIQGSREREVQKAATEIGLMCRTFAKSLAADTKRPPVEILGPAPSPLDRLRDRYRWQVLLKSACQDDLHALCDQVVTRQAEVAVGDIQVAVDVDPENMM
ncbi:MAG: primosomal protein N' [Desulfobulbaceae bacterium]|nr:primosomal protein N' [Desulfobulbaceae bacterium]